MTQPTGLMLHTQRLSTEDGPGIRTTVFLKHCPLQCAWCHNPESITAKPQVQWISARCIGCQSCVDACPKGCITLDEDGLTFDRNICDGCGICAQECPSLAIELLGTQISAQELVFELLKDHAYFEQSDDGGVTLSGGEPMMQAAFCREVFSRLKQAGIHTALDTCGHYPSELLDSVLPLVDIVLFDIKIMDTKKHADYTGQGNERILNNLRYLAEKKRSAFPDLRIWIRTPLIPGATDNEENLQEIGSFLDKHFNGLIERWELLAFNNMARDKYARLDMDWLFRDAQLMSQADLDRIEEIAKTSGLDPAVISVTGPTRVEAS